MQRSQFQTLKFSKTVHLSFITSMTVWLDSLLVPSMMILR